MPPPPPEVLCLVGEFYVSFSLRFARFSVKVSKWRMMSRGLVETLEARGTWAAERRLELRICPSDVERLEVLRPKVREDKFGVYYGPVTLNYAPSSISLCYLQCITDHPN